MRGLVLIAGGFLAAGPVPAEQEKAIMSDAQLSPCPDSPNCVSSLEQRPDHFIEPIRFQGDPDSAKRRLLEVVEQIPGSEIVEEGGIVIKAVFTSRVFRFKDDVIFYIDEQKSLIQLRSASRVGYYDFGVNRQRCETIRDRFNKP